MGKTTTQATSRAPTPAVLRRPREGLLQTVEVRRAEVSELLVTALPADNTTDPLAATEAIYDSAVGFLAERGARAFHEKLYAPAALSSAIGQVRERAFSSRSLEAPAAWTLVSGRAWEVERVGGLQLHAIAGGTAQESDIVDTASGTGTVLEFAGVRHLYLSAVTGTDDRGRLPEGGGAQASRMFENARGLLEANGFQFCDVARTWVYIPHILQWYREFNEARTSAYQRFGVFDESWPGVLPASTGIQGAGVTPAQCLMDLVAMRPAGEPVAIEPLANPRQSEATSYGSSFSRAVEVSYGGVSRLYISGTASIDEQGQTVYANDLEGQIFRTVLNVGSLLWLRNANWSDVCMATAFFKNAEDISAWERIRQTLGLTPFPVLCVVSDVCRPELLFELEATAVYVSEPAP